MRRGFLLLMLMLSAYSLSADGFSDWLKKERETFRGFRTDEDRQFREFLRKEWEEFEAFQAKELYSEPKFPEQPVVDAEEMPQEKRGFSAAAVYGSAYTEQAEKGSNRFFDYSYRGLPSTVIEFFGMTLRFPASEEELPRMERADNRGAAQFWDEISAIDLEALFEAISSARSDFALNDWGVARLCHAYAEAEMGPGRLESYGLTWFLLVKSGYDARIGYDGSSDGIYLLLPVDGTLYGAAYAQIEGRQYYFIDLGNDPRLPNRFYTYPERYPSAEMRMRFGFDRVPTLSRRDGVRELRFTYRGEEFALELSYDAGVVEFFSDHPQTEFGLYLASGASTEFSETVKRAFRPLLRGKSRREAANLLLRFVQTSLSYRTDQDQFDREKWMLPEEAIHYPYSDCDDRSILYAWLVRELLELPVVGIQWPGHMATAVAFEERVDGANFTAAGRIWTVCDPTYMGADIGMVMPLYGGQGFQVIPPAD